MYMYMYRIPWSSPSYVLVSARPSGQIQLTEAPGRIVDFDLYLT